MNADRNTSISWPAMPPKILSELKQHPKKNSGSLVKAMDKERQPKMIFVSDDLRESLKKKLSDSVKAGARVPRIVNLHRSRSLNITSTGKVPVRNAFHAMVNGSAASTSSAIPENDTTTDSINLSDNNYKGDTSELLTDTQKQETDITDQIGRSGEQDSENKSEKGARSKRSLSADDSSHESMDLADAPLRTSSVKKRKSSGLHSSQRSRTPSPPAKRDSNGSVGVQENLTNGFSQSPPKVPPAPPLPPVTRRNVELDISSDTNQSTEETLKYFNRTVVGETTFSSDNSQEARTLSLPQNDYLQTDNYENDQLKGNNSVNHIGKKPRRKVTKWSDKPKTVRASIKPGSVEELKRMFMKLGEENFKPSLIKKNNEFFLHTHRREFRRPKDAMNVFRASSSEEDRMQSEILSKTMARKYEQNWTEYEIKAPITAEESSTQETNRALHEPLGICIEIVTKDAGMENQDVGHTPTVEKGNSPSELTQAQLERNFEDGNTSYRVDINEWGALGKPDVENNDQSVETNQQRNSGLESATRNILIDSNKNLKPDKQPDGDSESHVTTYDMSSAAGELYTFDSEQYTASPPRGASSATSQSEAQFTQQTTSSETFCSNAGTNEDLDKNIEHFISEKIKINIDTKHTDDEAHLERKSSDIQTDNRKMMTEVDMTSFSGHGFPTIHSSSNRYSTVTSDNNKHEKVYVVQDNVGDLYVVEDITDKTRETTTVQPAQVVESVEDESVRTLNTTNSSIRSFDFAGHSGTVSVETGVERNKAHEVISTLFGDISTNKDLSFKEYPNESIQHENIDLGRSLTVTASDLNSGIASGQKELHSSVTEQKGSVLHEDTYEKTVLNIVTDNSNKPLWTDTTKDTQTCAWLENNRDYDRGGETTYVTSMMLGDRMSGTTSDSIVIPEPDYPKEMNSSTNLSAGGYLIQNEASSGSLVPVSASHDTVALYTEPVASQQPEQTSVASGEVNENETESEITITTRTTAVVGELVDMHIGIPPDLQSSLQDLSSNPSPEYSPRRNSSIIRLRTKSPVSTSPQSDSLDNSPTRISDITETTDFMSDSGESPDRRNSRENSRIITVSSGSYNQSSPRKMKSYPDEHTIELVNGFDPRDRDGQKYRIVTSKREYDTDRDSSYRNERYYEEYVSKSSPEPRRRRSSTPQVCYAAAAAPVRRERYQGETDSQYSSKGTSSGVPSVGDDHPQYRVTHIELAPPGREPHRTTYREIERTDRDADYYTLHRRDSGGDLWQVNSKPRPDRRLPNTSTSAVSDELLDERPGRHKTTHRAARSLSDERLNVRNKRLSSGFKSGSQSDSDDGQRVFKTVKTIQINGGGKSQTRPRRHRRGSRGSPRSDTDDDNRGTSRYRVSNIDENSLLEKEWKKRIPDDGKKHLYKVASPSRSSRQEPVYKIGRHESAPALPVKNTPITINKKRFHETSANYYTKTSPSHFDSGYFDDSNYLSKSPSYRNVIEIDTRPRRSRSFDEKTGKSLFRVLNVDSRDHRTPDVMRRTRRHSPVRYRSASLSSDSDDDTGKYYITSPKHERKSPNRDGHESRRRPTKEKNVYYVHRSASPENVHLKRVRSLSPGQKYRISNHTNDRSDDVQFVTSSPSSTPRSNYVVYDRSPERDGRSRSPEVTDLRTYRTEKTIVLQPSRDMSPRLQHKGGRYFTQNGVSMDQTIDSGTGTEIASSDNEGNGETIHQRRYERVEEIYEVRKEPQHVDLVEENADGSLKVQRGKILIQNQMDPTKDDDDFDDNLNVFDNSFHLQKDNPLYQSDPDVYKSTEDYDNQDAIQQEVTQDITFETVNKIAQTRRKNREGKNSDVMYIFLVSNVNTNPPRHIHKTLNV